MDRCQQLIFSPITAISQPQMGNSTQKVSKKQKVESIKEEPSLVGFVLKLNLVDLMIRRGPPRKPLPYYWSGYWAVKSSTSSNSLGDQETKVAGTGRKTLLTNQVARTVRKAWLTNQMVIGTGTGRKALLTILAEINENPPRLAFMQELILFLRLYHVLRNLRFYLFDRRDEEKQPARRDAMLARGRESMARAQRIYQEKQRKRLEDEIKDVRTVK